MPHTTSTRVPLKIVAILIGLLAAAQLGSAPIKAALPIDQTDVYNFAPTGVTIDEEVRLVYHNFTKSQVKVRFVLLDARGQDLFVLNKIAATFVIGPGMMGTAVMPCNGILGANQTRAEVTGGIALWLPPGAPQPFTPRPWVGPASLQIVDEITQRTLVSVGVVGPTDLGGAIGPVDLGGAIGPIN